METGAKNDITYDFAFGVQYLTGNSDPILKNPVFRDKGETIKFSKLSFDMAFSFGLMF